MTTPYDTSVIVVGGSLVGLSTALFLSHWKVPVILLERHPDSSAHPRAIGYTARTIELLRSVGIEKQLPQPIGRGDGPPRRIIVESLAGKWHREQDWTKKPVQSPQKNSHMKPVEQDKKFSPVEGVATAQDKIEPVLRASAIEQGADLRLGHTVEDWQQDESGVTVTIVGPDSEQFTIRGKYLVACDGGRSPIREKLGINRQGVGHLRNLRSILFRCPQIDHFLERGYVQFQIQDRDDGFEAFMTTYGDRRWALMWNEDGDAYMDEATQKARIRKAAGIDDLSDDDISIITTGQWSIAGFIADTFSSGRVFLAGDAAHTLPPNRGGYGANTGIADAHNIAWKLAAVLNGTSSEQLLETYDAERRPVALVRHDQIFGREDYRRYVEEREWSGKNTGIIDDMAMEFGQLYRSGSIIGDADAETLPPAKRPDEWNGQPGTRAPHIVLNKANDVTEISSLDIFGMGWVLVSTDEAWRETTEHASDKTGVKCDFVHIGTDYIEAVSGSFNNSFGLDASGAALIRPDGFIAWRAVKAPDNARSLFPEILGQSAYATKARF
jgi:2-polyprenyl-6-methoxyphenol hydroxylase-like FAD-dependent oxidoreductase